MDRSPTLLLTLKDLQKLLDSSFRESTEMCLSVCDESVVCPQIHHTPPVCLMGCEQEG